MPSLEVCYYLPCMTCYIWVQKITKNVLCRYFGIKLSVSNMVMTFGDNPVIKHNYKSENTSTGNTCCGSLNRTIDCEYYIFRNIFLNQKV